MTSELQSRRGLALRMVTSQQVAWTPACPSPGTSLDPPPHPAPNPVPTRNPASCLPPPPTDSTLSPILERLRLSFTNLCNNLYQPHWPASAHLHLTPALEDFMSSLPNCLPRNRLPSLAADSKRVRSTRVCLVYIFLHWDLSGHVGSLEDYTRVCGVYCYMGKLRFRQAWFLHPNL